MNGKGCWGVAVLSLIGLCVEAAEPGVVVIRGQSPTNEAKTTHTGPVEAYGPIIGSAPGYGEFSKHSHKDFKTFPQFHNNNFGYEGGYYAGPEGYYTSHGKKAYTYGAAGGDACQYGDAGCPHCHGKSKGCPHCCHGGPKHYTTYEFKQPKNLVYPPNVMPAGMVQYPYYTLRGPTDFFMK